MTDAREWPATAAAEKTVDAVRSADALRAALAAHAQQVTTAITDAGTRAVAGLALGQVFAGEPDVGRAMLRALDVDACYQVAAAASDLAMLAHDLTPEGRDAERTYREQHDTDTGRAVAEIHVASIMRLAYLGRQRDVARALAELTADERARLVTAVVEIGAALATSSAAHYPAPGEVPGAVCNGCPPGAPLLVWRAWATWETLAGPPVDAGGGWAHPNGVPADGHLPAAPRPGDELPLVGFAAADDQPGDGRE